MLMACGLPAVADGGTSSCGLAMPQALTSSAVDISVPKRGFGEISLTMSDGQHYLLAGVVVPASARDRDGIVNALRARLAHSLEMRVVDDGPDRRGRRSIELLDAGTSVAARLAASGLVLASGTACSGPVRAGEAEARALRRGLWREAAFLHQAGDADMDLPDFAVITGKPLSVGQSGRTTYLNFGTSFRQDVTVRVPDATRLALEAGGVNVAALAQRRVEVRGYWMAHDGPELVLQHPEALDLPAEAGGED